MMNIICGWTLEQIAFAAARYKNIERKMSPEPTLQGIFELQCWWQQMRFPPPLSVKLLAPEQDMDYGWAAEAIGTALQTFYGRSLLAQA